MIDMKEIEEQLEAYIKVNFVPAIPSPGVLSGGTAISRVIGALSGGLAKIFGSDAANRFDIDEINFLDQVKGEKFSEMIWRLIKESGEKNSTIYKRANIDRRHFSKILNNPNYKPSKQTALTFAIALKLNIEKAKELLSTAGFLLTKSNLADVIVSYFIERKIFDVNCINQTLYKYKQPLLGMGEPRKTDED